MSNPATFKDYMKRMFIRYIIALIAFLFVLFIIFMILNYRIFVVQANLNSNQAINRFIAGQWDLYQSGIQTLSENTTVHKALMEPANFSEVSQLLYEFSLAQQLKANFVLLDRDSSIISTNLYKTNQPLFLGNKAVQEALSRLNSDPSITHSGFVPISLDYGQKSNLFFARAIKVSGTIAGYLLFSLQEDGLSTFMRDKDADIVVITDAFNNIIFSTNRLMIDPLGKYNYDLNEQSSIFIDQKPYYVTTAISPSGNLRVITMTSIAKQQQVAQLGILFLIGVGGFLLVLIRFWADKITDKNLRSIDELLYAVNECRHGNINYRIKSQTFEEFQTLYDSFNSMMLKLRQLLRSNSEMAERKRLMEVRHLEGQFNPHFVFNVMEALRYEIIINPTQASQMIVAFANLMRYSIHYGSTHVPLKTDIRYVQDYLLLQKMRYTHRLEYTITIADALLQCKIPKLLIQPLVENSIVHGLEKAKSITIVISGRILDHTLELKIKDNGPGIDEMQLLMLKAMLADETSMPERIGLYNVHRVAQLLYGSEYGLTIESTYGQGTQILLRIPMILENDYV